MKPLKPSSSERPIRRFRLPLSRALLGPLVAQRSMGLALLLVAGLQLGATRFGWSFWRCPILQHTGCPCPGCGLSRAGVAWVQGDWGAGWALHPFAPVFIIALIILAVAQCLPTPLRLAMAGWITAFEERTWVSLLLVAALLANWLSHLSKSG